MSSTDLETAFLAFVRGQRVFSEAGEVVRRVRELLAFAGARTPREALDAYVAWVGAREPAWQAQRAAELARMFVFFHAEAARRTRPPPDPDAWDRAVDALVERLRLRGMARRTEQCYAGWLRRFARYVEHAPPHSVGAGEVERFLSGLALHGGVAASTQNVAFAALECAFRVALGRPLGAIGGTVRAARPRRVPVVLARDEVDAVLARMRGPYALMARLMYGCGLRVDECLSLRVKDVDLARELVTVRGGKGGGDRVTLLPRAVRADWAAHLARVRALYELDRATGEPGVALPAALERKCPSAAREWAWFWAFPAPEPSRDPRSGVLRRHHRHVRPLQRAFQQALDEAGVAKAASVHTLRHAFATQLVEGGTDVRTVQELLGHRQLETTMLYTHVARRVRPGVVSPLDRPAA